MTRIGLSGTSRVQAVPRVGVSITPMPPWPRAILHVDMDAFFASVEQRDDPALRGRAVLVGGAGRRGVVQAASYEARAFGCRSAMPTARALRLCPHAVVVPGRFDAYRAASRLVMGVLNERTPLVQPVSIDEAFCDVTGSQRLLGPPEEMAAAIRRDVRQLTGLTCSVGVAASKFMAKLASDLDKPDGLTIVRPGQERATLDPLPIGKIWGVGPVAQAWLAGRGVRTVADLRGVPAAALDARLGKWGGRLRRLIDGLDDRPVVPERQAKQVSHERTFAQDVADPDVARAVLLWQAEDVAARLRATGVAGRHVVLKLRFGDFTTITRRHTLPQPTDVTGEIWRAGLAVFDGWAAAGGWRPLRLLGLGVGGFDVQPQLDLFPDAARDRQRRIDAATDAVRGKFGQTALRRGMPTRPTPRRSGPDFRYE